MPATDFEKLPASARVWIFASDRALNADESRMLLEHVDGFLDQWKAHGTPLRSAREWRDDHFLVVGVDPTVEQASGCSIDGMFRGLRELERRLNTTLVAGGRVFYRDQSGRPRKAARQDVSGLYERGDIGAETPVYDTSVTDAGSYRSRFMRPANETWVASLFPAQSSQPSSRSATNSSSARNG